MKNHIRILDSDRIQVDTLNGWTDSSEISVTIGNFVINMSRVRADRLMTCLDAVLNASASDETFDFAVKENNPIVTSSEPPDIDVTMLIQTSEDAA